MPENALFITVPVNEPVRKPPVSLEEFDPVAGESKPQPHCEHPLAQYLDEALALLGNVEGKAPVAPIELDPRAESLRWFYLPEAG